MRPYRKLGTEKKQDIEGRHFWLAVIAFAPGATVKMDDGAEIVVTGNFVLRPTTLLGVVHPWKQITTTGAISLLIGENHEPAPPNAGALVQSVPSALILSDVVTLGVANPATQLVVPTQVQRSVMIQNHGVFPVILSEIANPTLAGGAGSKILAMLAACAALYDGTGGSIVLDNMADSVFGVGKGGAADVSVNVW